MKADPRHVALIYRISTPNLGRPKGPRGPAAIARDLSAGCCGQPASSRSEVLLPLPGQCHRPYAGDPVLSPAERSSSPEPRRIRSGANIARGKRFLAACGIDYQNKTIYGFDSPRRRFRASLSRNWGWAASSDDVGTAMDAERCSNS